MQEESQRSRPRFQPPVQQKPAALSPKAPDNTRKETAKVSVFLYVSKCVNMLNKSVRHLLSCLTYVCGV